MFMKARLLATTTLLLSLLAASADKPNIIYILADDLGYGDVQCLGGERSKIATPHIDQLAANGITLTEAHSTSAVCTPSRYSVLTGRYNWRTTLQKGVFGGYGKPLIKADRLTVPSLLRKHGYATACIGKWHLGMDIVRNDPQAEIGNGPTTRGFDYFFGISASADMAPYAFIENTRFTEAPTEIKELYKGRPGPAAPSFKMVDILPRLVQKSGEWIEKNKAQPFFLYLPLNSPHTPLAPTGDWKGKSGLGDYADFVMQTDWAVGEVVKAVEKSGLSNNTLIILTSDNGYAPYVGTAVHDDPALSFEAQGAFANLEAKGHFPSELRRGYKADVWDGGHRIPFIARWPAKIQKGSSSNELVCLSDLIATCAVIVDTTLPASAGEDSVSILPLLLGEPFKPSREAVVHHSINGSFAIRRGKWKLNLCPSSGGWSDPKPNSSEANRLPEVQLYDMEKDVGERSNEAANHPAIVESLITLLQKYIADGRSTPGAIQKNDAKIEIWKEKQ